MPPRLTDEERASRKIYNAARSALRRAYIIWPGRMQCLLNARRPALNKRLKWEYQCNTCKEWFKLKDVQVDHVKPCGAFTDETHHKSFVTTLFLGEVQVLCTPCHDQKTNTERKR